MQNFPSRTFLEIYRTHRALNRIKRNKKRGIKELVVIPRGPQTKLGRWWRNFYFNPFVRANPFRLSYWEKLKDLFFYPTVFFYHLPSDLWYQIKRLYKFIKYVIVNRKQLWENFNDWTKTIPGMPKRWLQNIVLAIFDIVYLQDGFRKRSFRWRLKWTAGLTVVFYFLVSVLDEVIPYLEPDYHWGIWIYENSFMPFISGYVWFLIWALLNLYFINIWYSLRSLWPVYVPVIACGVALQMHALMYLTAFAISEHLWVPLYALTSFACWAANEELEAQEMEDDKQEANVEYESVPLPFYSWQTADALLRAETAKTEKEKQDCLLEADIFQDRDDDVVDDNIWHRTW